MSEIINLAKDKPDTYVYQQAAEILCDTLEKDYSFVIQLWDHEKPKETKYPKVLISMLVSYFLASSPIDETLFSCEKSDCTKHSYLCSFLSTTK